MIRLECSHLVPRIYRGRNEGHGIQFLDSAIIPSVLVIDFDEFVLCTESTNDFNQKPSSLYTLSGQRAALRQSVHQSRLNTKDEMVWGRYAVPNTSSIPECLEDRVLSTNITTAHYKTIFDCYGGYHFKNRHNTIKTMHQAMSCPSTDFHFACCSACPCGKKWQSKCSLIHLRPMHSYNYRGDDAQVDLQKLAQYYMGSGSIKGSKSEMVDDPMRIELADIWRDPGTKVLL